MSSDIYEPQVLVHYPDDLVEWHHRVLLRRLREAIWLVLTSDLSVEVDDLGESNLLPLVRGGAVPAVVHWRCYLFAADAAAAVPARHAQATRLATSSVAGLRRVPRASLRLPLGGGDEVVEGPAFVVICGAVGLTRWRQVFVERVPLAEVAAWEQDKQTGAGHDRRLGAPRGVLAIAAVLPLQEATSGLRLKELREVADWPHQGPRRLCSSWPRCSP